MIREHHLVSRLVCVEAVDEAELRRELVAWSQTAYEIGRLAAIKVVHVATRTELRTIAWTDESKLDEVRDQVAQIINKDARNLRNQSQLYAVEAYYGTSSFPTANMRIRVRWDDDEGSDSFGTGAITQDTKGDRALLQKHARDAMEFGTKASKHALLAQTRMLDRADDREVRLWARIDELERENRAMKAAVEEALDKKLERELKAERARELTKELREMLGFVKVIAPALLNKHFGTDFPVPPYAHPFMEQMRTLFDLVSQDDETMYKIISALDGKPTTQTALVATMASFQDIRELAQARAKNIATAETKTKQLTNGANGSSSNGATTGRGIY